MLVASDFQHKLDQDLLARDVAGVSARHRAVFLHLGQHGASRSVELAQAAGIRPQSMMVIVHEMEELGLIERRQDPDDSRAKLIDFTGKGKKLIAELGCSTETVWMQYAAVLGEPALRQTFQALQQLTDHSDTQQSTGEQ